MKKIISLVLTFVLIFGLVSCKSCKKEEEHVHTYASTWSSDEAYHFHASTCGHDVVADKAEHSWNTGSITVEATETSVGEKTYTCTVCGKTKTEEIPMLDHVHTFSSEWDFNGLFHYHPSTCGHDVVEDKEEHTFVSGVCSVCGRQQTALTVAEAKQVTNPNAQVTVRGVVIGNTGNYDGGYVWVVIKDENSNEVCAVRKGLAGAEKDGLSSDLALGTGYSYNPSSAFSLGDIVELPVGVKVNSAVQGGEAGKILFYWRGDSYEASRKTQFLAKYVKGHTDDYLLDQSQYVETISNQGELEDFVLSSQPQWKLVKFVGTNESPLKFTTQAATTNGKGDITREYIYIFYDSPTSVNNQKIGGAAPVFSNFGNKFNLGSNLSTLLFGQTQYEALNFSHPYYFIGEIYCLIVGGSTAYYHFVVFDSSCIHKISNTVVVDNTEATLAKKEFYRLVEEKAASIGITVANPVTSPVGVSNVVCCEDMVKIGIAATGVDLLKDVWNRLEYSCDFVSNTGKEAHADMTNLVLSDSNYIQYLKPYYNVIGTKHGSLKATDARPYPIINLLMVVEGPDDKMIVGYVYSTHDESSTDNTYTNMKILYDILVAKYNNQDTTELEASLKSDKAAGVIVEQDAYLKNGYNWFGSDSEYVHYSKQGTDLITTASSWKTMTALTSLSLLTEADMDALITVGASELSTTINAASIYFNGGEVITLRDALHFMMLLSSNVAPSVIARYIGERSLNGDFNS